MTSRFFDLRYLVVANALCMASMMGFVAVVGPVTRSLRLPEWAAGLAITVAGVLWMLLARGWGRASDRHGRRRVLYAGIAGFALSYFALAAFVEGALDAPPAAALSIAALVAGRAAMGAFFAGVQPTLVALVADNVAAERRAAAMAKLGSGGAIGMMVGPAAAGWLALQDLAAPMYVAALIALLAIPVVARAVPDRRAVAHAGPRATAKLLDARLAIPLATAFTFMFSIGVAQVTIGFFVIDRFGLDTVRGASAAGNALTAVGIALIVAQTLVARFRGVPPRRWLLAGSLLAALGFGATGFSVSLPQLLAFYFVSATGMGFLFPALQALAANAVGPHEQGAAAGSISSMQGLGMAVGPVVGTLLYRLGPSAPYFAIACGLVLLGLVVLAARR